MVENVHSRRRQPKPGTLIVVVAFDRCEDGELFPAFGPADQQNEEQPIRAARALADKHVGVIAWSREATPTLASMGRRPRYSSLASCRV